MQVSQASQAEVMLTAVGDVRPMRAALKQVPDDSDAVVSRLRGDIVFGNLEIVLSTQGQAASKLVVARAEPEAVNVLRHLGLTAVSLANNHVFDFGSDGLLSTCRTLQENGIRYVGAGANETEAWSPLVFSCNGLRLALLAVATTVPPGAAARAGQPGLAALRAETAYRVDPTLLCEQPGTPPYVHTWVPAEELERLQQAVGNAQTAADVVVVSVHWGVAYEDEPAEYQRQVARALADAGVALVLGHHPHQLQGLGTEGRTYVVYSLGDFLLHFRRPAHIRLPGSTLVDEAKTRRSLIVRARLNRSGVAQVELVPVFLDDAGEPRVASGDQEEAIFVWLERLSAPLGGRLQRLEGGGALLLPANSPQERGAA